MTSPSIFANFNYPVRYRLGAGRAAELPALCKARSIARPLVVTDPGVKSLSWFASIIDSLAAAGLEGAVFSDLRPNPIGRDVDAGVHMFREHGADGVVLLGGGSAMDVGKCVALLANNPGTVFDYEDVGDNFLRADPSKIAPMIALPTTSGTGSEVGRASVIIDEHHEKKIIFHPQMQPPDVIADPLLTVGLPPALTAFTGVDAFVHCFEAFCVPSYHPMADGIALEGMRLIAENLPRAVADGADVEARTHMILASSMGATAFQKGLGAVHAIAHALGGKHDVHHGMANAILLPYCMVFNRSAISQKCTTLGRHLGLPDPTFDAVLDYVLQLRQQLNIPHTLGAVPSMDEEQAHLLGPVAHKDAALPGNPRQATEADLVKIMLAALSGDLG